MPELPASNSDRATRSGARTRSRTSEGRAIPPSPLDLLFDEEAARGSPAVVTMMSP